MGMFDNLTTYRKLLSKKLGYAAWVQDSVWGQFMGFIGNDDGRYPKSVALSSPEAKLKLKATGQPIEVLTNFEHEGGDYMDIPLMNPLTQAPVYGDKQLLGNEEKRRLTYKACQINQVRHGVLIRDGKMGEQKLKKPEVQKWLMQNAQIDLSDYFRRYLAYQGYPSILERYSQNLTAAAADGGSGLTRASHPNFYVLGNGKATWSDTPATYETNVETALNTLTDVAAKHFSISAIEVMVRLASRHKIRPAMKIGNNWYYPIIISEAAADQLWKDQYFRETIKYGSERGEDKNPLFTGLIATLRRAAIIVDQNMPSARTSVDSGYSSTYGTINYGNTNPLANPQDTGNKKLAILLGPSALACGYASPLKFEQETWDYKQKKTEGADMIFGMERADIYDKDGEYGTANLFRENTSSLVLAHYAKDDSVDM